MYRASVAGLLTMILSGSAVFGQSYPGNAQQGFQFPANNPQANPAQQGQVAQQAAFVYSEQVTCTCGQVNENYEGGPRTCSQCDQTLPDPPTYGGQEVTTATYFPQEDVSSVAPVAYTFGEMCEMAGGGGGGNSSSIHSCLSRLGSCFGGPKGSPMSENLRITPSMIGGGFGGGSGSPGGTNFQGTQQIQFQFQNAIGTLVGPYAGANSDVIYDVLGNVANPDYESVGLGTQFGSGFWQFAVVEAIPAPDALLPPGATFANGNATQVTQAAAGVITTGDLWDIVLSANQNFRILIPDAANAGAATVGRTRIAENNSPMPRTRVFFNYDLLDNVPLTNGGVTVNRFTPGMEYAIGSCCSVELRVPFASTLSSDIRTDGSTPTGRTELGDVFLAYKKLICQGTDYAFSGGVGVTLPSTNDLTVGTGGNAVLLVENQAVHVMPFIASLAMLTDRVFYQGFMQADFDVNGNQVYVDNGGGLGNVGRIRDVSRLYSSGALGYWCRQRGEKPDAFFSAIIPTVELHFEQTLESSTAFTAGNFVLGNTGGKSSSLTAVVGNTFEITPRETVVVGYAAGLGNSSDQFMDGQLRFLWNRYF